MFDSNLKKSREADQEVVVQQLLKNANNLVRAERYDEALDAYSRLIELRPRSYWLRLNAAFASAKSGRLHEARKWLEAVDCAKDIDQNLIASFREHIAKDLSRGHTFPLIDVTTDYHTLEIGGQKVSSFPKLSANKKFPSGYPFDLELPRIAGNGNDYSFVSNSVNRFRAKFGHIPSRHLLVWFLASLSEYESALHFLDSIGTDKSKVSVTFVTAGFDIRGHRRPDVAHRHIEYDVARPLAQLNDKLLSTEADSVIFLPTTKTGNPYLLNELGDFHRLAPCSAHIFREIAQEESNNAPFDQFDLSFNDDWKGSRYPFSQVRFGNLALSMQMFRKCGGFKEDIISVEASFFDLSYRAYLQGAYLIPVSVEVAGSSGFPEVIKSPSRHKEIEEHCAASWWRKRDGIFLVPKVSVYIPSYNNGRFIVEAVESVLRQDFQDLEVCIADDGSTDDTLQILDSAFRGETRVRWEAGANGGIGVASNRALRMTRGLYVGQLDSDDVLKPGAIRRLAEFLDENPSVGCVYSSCERIDSAGNYLQPEYSFPVFSREKMMMTSIAHHFRMFRKQCWSRTAGFREDIINGIDYDMFLKLSEVTQFHHIDEVFYQRRWHGENTSFVNEGEQSRNTTVVLNKSLERIGLKRRWVADAKDPSQPRKITYSRTKPTTKIFFWPDYSGANPYQNLVYSSVRDKCEVFSGDIDAALKSISDSKTNDSVIFHLHWLNALLQAGGGNVKEVADAFLAKLEIFKKLGGKVIWTVHNASSHEGEHVNLELELSKKICSIADRIHLHTESSLSELSFEVPRNKMLVVPHGSYVGYYPDTVERSSAREIFGFSESDFVVAFTGQIRRYKGLEKLVRAFGTMDASARLLITGKANYNFSELLEKTLPIQARGRVFFRDRFVSDNALQLIYKAADVAVFPYERVLTSGSALLAMSFGCSPILPDFAMGRELLQSGKYGHLYDSKHPDGLRRALAEACAAKESGELCERRGSVMGASQKLNWGAFSKLFEL